jgi:hypothetical protein
MLRERFEQAKAGGPGKVGKESYDRRANIAYLLYTLSKARKPGAPAQFLDESASERVKAVVGLVAYGNAAAEQTAALSAALQRTLAAIADDRQGYAIQAGGKLEEVPGFVGRYQALVKQLVDTVGQVKEEEARLGRLGTLQKQHEKQYEERKADYEEVVATLLKQRNETALQAAELRRLEQQLFRAQLELADAARTNERLERQIREAERSARGRSKQ